MESLPEGSVTFWLNNTVHTLQAWQVDPTVTLNDFIRSSGLTGTKLGCGEGGCGACTVLISEVDRTTSETVHRSCNSCLRLVASLDGAAVTTTEGLGSKANGFHPVHTRIAEHNGSQCGFCTPGMVMALYAGLKAGVESAPELENRLDGNLCRCTGYRPLLAAAKSMCKDGGTGLGGGLDSDTPSPICGSQLELSLPEEAMASHSHEYGSFTGSGRTFIRCTSVGQAMSVLSQHGSAARIVVGNTSTGIYKDQNQTVLVDLSKISALRCEEVGVDGISIGGARSVTDLESLLRTTANNLGAQAAVSYLPLADHLLKIAGWHVRNMASVAGNLCMAKKHGFLSDLATVLLGAGAKVTLLDPSGESVMSLEDFFAAKPLESNQIMTSVTVPFAHVAMGSDDESTVYFRTFRVALRAQMCHAYVNASFMVKVQNRDNRISQACMAFGGLAGHAIRVHEFEQWLQGKIVCLDTATAGYHCAEKLVPVGSGGQYAKGVVSGFVFKFLVALQGHLSGGEIPPALEGVTGTMGGWSNSGAGTSRRLVSHGSQSFDYPATHAPVSDPVRKVGAGLQAAGEAQYTADVREVEGTLFAACALSSSAKADFELRTDSASRMPGVHAIVTGQDVKFNSCVGAGGFMDEPILAKDTIDHTGQPMAVVVAASTKDAEAAAKVLEADVLYKPHADALLTLEEAIKAPDAKWSDAQLFMGSGHTRGDFEEAISKAAHTATGTVLMKEQKHFPMEPNVTYVQPDEDGCYTVHCSTQYAGGVQSAIAKALDIPSNHVEVKCRRLGGAFGGKLARNIPAACATAVASEATGRPVKMQLSRNADMKMMGGRHGVKLEYTVGYEDDGTITALNFDYHCDAGHSADTTFFFAFALCRASDECYYVPNMSVKCHVYTTNTASRTACRGPGEIQATVAMETVLEHVAALLGVPGMAVRAKNLYPQHQPELWVDLAGNPFTQYTVPRMWETAMSSFEQKQHDTDSFNATSPFLKRGVSATTVKYSVSQSACQASVGIYGDGSVVCHHACAEMGQGLFTKVIQVAAYTLGKIAGGPVPMKLIRNADTNTLNIPKIGMTGGSVGSENASEGVRVACEELIARIRRSDNPKVVEALEFAQNNTDPLAAWTGLVGAAVGAGISLLATSDGLGQGAHHYHNWGVAVSQVEVDTLTGESTILSTEMHYDCGKSLNPALDIGQAEGAFVMGVGCLLREDLLVDHRGVLVSDGTWEYKIPSTIDIPLDFKINFIDKAEYPDGVLSSKAVGEPPLVLSSSVFTAIRAAIRAAREERDLSSWFQMNVPCTPQHIHCLLYTSAAAAEADRVVLAVSPIYNYH
eukprot:TRINITY_DN23012_c0_g1_i2.p1 TRINITY_DN23012_c0_g1~~TRINITY_DN23012_c0_g1_i2.p1  ORF type:complete len:1326 (-),score=305.56 TRINITY_DN23012_c0_g1_i2:8-3985(-)